MKDTWSYIDEWISDYLSGNISVEDRKQLTDWINSSKENRQYYLRQQEIWFSYIDESENEYYDKNRAFEVFQTRMNEAEKRVVLLSKWLQYAAIFVGVCILSYFSYYQREMKLKQTLTEIRVEAPLGSQTRLYLPDHSLVVLNAGSTLSYSQDFGVYNRNIELNGEAYFEVTCNSKFPFEVEGKSVVVKVLGTKFNFKDYPEDEEVSVQLYQGKVAIDNRIQSEEAMILHPNEKMVMKRLDGKMRKSNDEGSASAAWREGQLIMNNMPLSEVVKLLQRTYAVNIHVTTDSLNLLYFNGHFNHKEMNVKEILDVLSGTQRIRYILKNNNITIY